MTEIRNMVYILKNILKAMIINSNYKLDSTSPNSKYEVFIFQLNILRF